MFGGCASNSGRRLSRPRPKGRPRQAWKPGSLADGSVGVEVPLEKPEESPASARGIVWGMGAHVSALVRASRALCCGQSLSVVLARIHTHGLRFLQLRGPLGGAFRPVACCIVSAASPFGMFGPVFGLDLQADGAQRRYLYSWRCARAAMRHRSFGIAL